VSLIAACCLGAEPRKERKDDPLPLTIVAKYLVDYEQATTVRRERLEAPAKDRLYSGIVRVVDVTEESRGKKGGAYVIVTRMPQINLVRLDFRIEDATEKKKAESLEKGQSIRVTAKFAGMVIYSSSYVNVAPEYYGNMVETAILEAPAKE